MAAPPLSPRRWPLAHAPGADWLGSSWALLRFGLQSLVLALSPSSYRGTQGLRVARQLHRTTWRVLPTFTVLGALLSLVLIRVVLVTAQSYGLSQFALEMVVRVLVLELIPLAAALFVVLRVGMATSTELTAMRLRGEVEALRQQGVAALHRVLVPQVVANGFAVVLLAAMSCLLALVLAYVVVHGFSPWGFEGFTRLVGRVFEPPIVLGLLLKVGLFSLAVAVIPVTAALRPRLDSAGPVVVPHGTAGLFLVLVLIEAASLAVKYI